MIRFKLINEILKNNEFIPPRTLVNNILDEYLKKEEEHAKKSKYPFNKEEARKRMEKSAETEVKWYLVKNEIQKAENISLTDQDLNDLAESESVKTGLSVEKLISYYKSSNQGERILDKKLFDFLKSSNTIVKVDAEKFKSKQEVTNEK
jgi:trigger factor